MTRNLFFAIVACIFFAGSVRAEDAIPLDTLQAIKIARCSSR